MIVVILMGFVLSAIMVMFMMTMYAAISGKLSNVEAQIENQRAWQSNKIEDVLEKIDAFIVNHDLSEIHFRLDDLGKELVENSRDHVRLVEQIQELAESELLFDLQKEDFEDILDHVIKRLKEVPSMTNNAVSRIVELDEPARQRFEALIDQEPNPTPELMDLFSPLDDLEIDDLDDLPCSVELTTVNDLDFSDEILFEDEIETVELQPFHHYAHQIIRDEPIALTTVGAIGEPSHRPILADSMLLKIYGENEDEAPIIQVGFDAHGKSDLIIQDPDGNFIVDPAGTQFDHKSGTVKLILSSGKFKVGQHRATIDYEFDPDWLRYV